ncbi:MAG: glycosyltransferase family 39 protein [candidate division WOR-3 bacterium]
MSKWAELAIMAISAILALSRFAGLSRMSIWMDEAMSYFCSAGPWFKIRILETTIPPLYYLFANICLNIRDSEAFLRLPAAVAGALSVLASYFLAKELGFPRMQRALVALFTSASPWLFFYSQEARSYTLVVLFCLLASIAFLRFERGKAWWLVCGAFLGLGLWSQYVVAFFTVGLWAYVLAFRRERPVIMGLLVSTIIASLTFLPWAIYAFSNPPPPVSIKKTPLGEMMSFVYGWFPYFFGFSLGPSVREIRIEGIWAIIREWPWLAAGGTAALLPVLKIGSLIRNKGFVFMLTCALLPPVLLLALSLLPGLNITHHPRYTAWSGVFLLFVWLWLAMSFKTRALSWISTALMLGLMCVSDLNFFFNRRYYKEDVRSAAALLRANRKADEPLFVASGNVGQALLYYYTESFVGIDRSTDQDTITLSGNRIWLMLSREWEVSTQPLMRRLEMGYRLSGDWDLPGVRLLLYERP